MKDLLPASHLQNKVTSSSSIGSLASYNTFDGEQPEIVAEKSQG